MRKGKNSLGIYLILAIILFLLGYLGSNIYFFAISILIIILLFYRPWKAHPKHHHKTRSIRYTTLGVFLLATSYLTKNLYILATAIILLIIGYSRIRKSSKPKKKEQSLNNP